MLAEVAALRAENAKVLAENVALKAEAAALKARLAVAKQNPRNSSKPSSTEHPHAKPAPKPHVKPKTSNGQPGHEKQARELFPVEQWASVVDYKPQVCRGCGARLNGVHPEPDRKQVWDLPVIIPAITEHRLHRLTCSCCGKATRATLPAGGQACEAGPRLVWLVALLLSHYRCGQRKTAEFVRDVLNIPCSPGWVVKLQNVGTTGMRPAYDDLAARLPDQPSLNVDESPTKQANSQAWVWAFVAGRGFSPTSIFLPGNGLWVGSCPSTGSPCGRLPWCCKNMSS